MATITEQALLLGPAKSLVGVVAQPATPSAQADLPVVVILNSGIIHRVGANRMSVVLARALSELGHTVLRFDLSGIGDSEPRADGLAPLEANLSDIKEALDSLQATRQARRFILVGLCSGADHSVVYAGSDPRVVGLVLLDPSIPRTRRFYLHHYAKRLLRLRSWLNMARAGHPLRQGLKRLLSPSTSGETAAVGSAPEAQEPDLDHPEARAFLERAYAGALFTGNQFLAVLTDERDHRHNYRNQLLDAFSNLSFGTQLRLEFFRGTDHTFTSEANRARVVRLIVEWVSGTPFRVVAGPALTSAPTPAP